MTLTKKEAEIHSIIEERVLNGEILEDVIQEYVDDKELGNEWTKLKLK